MSRAITSTRLQGKHYMAIAKLVQGLKPTEVAQELGVDVGTIYTWQRWPLFQERLSQYVESVAQEQLDRGLEDATMELKQRTLPIIAWMQSVILGEIELKAADKQRWRMALDFLHHAGIIDRQQAAKAEGNPTSLSLNLNQDMRRQQVLAVGNADLEDRLKNFRTPKQIIGHQ